MLKRPAHSRRWRARTPSPSRSSATSTSCPCGTGRPGDSAPRSSLPNWPTSSSPLWRPDMQLTETVAVITGGGSGIGAALARRFAAEGAAEIVVVDRDLAAAVTVADEVGGVPEHVDVTDPAAVNGLVERTLARSGSID